MKIPIRLKICPCGGESLVWFQLEERDIQYKCQKCGEELEGAQGQVLILDLGVEFKSKGLPLIRKEGK